MADIVPADVRSRMMAGIRGKDTKPELIVRKGLHGRGFRFRLHDSSLPGKPDIVLPRYRAVIFVNGCFWHGHDCHLFKWPKTREEFWRTKIQRNREVDREALARLQALGWRILQVWECSLKGASRLGVEKVVSQAVDWLKSEQPLKEIRGSYGDDGANRLA